MECITLDNQHFSIIQDVVFLRPVPELYSIVYSHVKKLIFGAVTIRFTADICSSSVNQVSMLSLTAQWVDEDFVLK